MFEIVISKFNILMTYLDMEFNELRSANTNYNDYTDLPVNPCSLVFKSFIHCIDSII